VPDDPSPIQAQRRNVIEVLADAMIERGIRSTSAALCLH
jgi:hypothetical protein